MKKLVFIAFALLVNNAWCNKGTSAGELYKNKQFEEAAAAYEKLLEKGESAALHYNIGNCHYKLNNWGQAILHYEKALKHAPTDEDILFNLKMANGHTSDKKVTASPGIKKWFYSQLMVAAPDTWSLLGFSSGILSLVFLFFSRYLRTSLYKVIGRILLAPFILCTLFGWLLNNHLNQHNEGIILEPSVDVKTAPEDNAKAAFILHEGTKVSVSRENGEWTEIAFDNDRKGWIRNEALGRI